MQALTSGDGNLVHGAMRVLTGMKKCTSLKLIRGGGTASGKWKLLKWCPSNLFKQWLTLSLQDFNIHFPHCLPDIIFL